MDIILKILWCLSSTGFSEAAISVETGKCPFSKGDKYMQIVVTSLDGVSIHFYYFTVILVFTGTKHIQAML